ncbi:MAG: ABC transporter permease [Spirochaetota bacterium]
MAGSLLLYIIKRLLWMIPIVLGVAFLVFLIFEISPNDPAVNILGEYATPSDIKKFHEEFGLNRPFLLRYAHFVAGLFTGDLGTSFRGAQEVADIIFTRFPATVKLTVLSLFVALLIAIPAGIISAVRQYSAFDHISMVVALLGISIPNFWLGLVLILFFSVRLEWLPSLYEQGNWLSYLMPALVLGTALSASTARMMRSSMLEVIRQDYITTARAKGLPEKQVIGKHALKNALIPVLTVVGLQFAGMLGGSAITEKVFSWPGLGAKIVDAQSDFDYPLVLGGVVYIAIVVSLVNLAIDLLYLLIEPALRAQFAKK